MNEVTEEQASSDSYPSQFLVLCSSLICCLSHWSSSLSKGQGYRVSATREMSDLVIVHLAAQAFGSLHYCWTSCHIWAEKHVSRQRKKTINTIDKIWQRKDSFLKNQICGNYRTPRRVEKESGCRPILVCGWKLFSFED